VIEWLEQHLFNCTKLHHQYLSEALDFQPAATNQPSLSDRHFLAMELSTTEYCGLADMPEDFLSSIVPFPNLLGSVTITP